LLPLLLLFSTFTWIRSAALQANHLFRAQQQMLLGITQFLLFLPLLHC
jgi:hypothetical protein